MCRTGNFSIPSSLLLLSSPVECAPRYIGEERSYTDGTHERKERGKEEEAERSNGEVLGVVRKVW